MTKKLKIVLICVLFSVATVCVCVFAGCKVKYTVDELRDKYNLTAQITYFLNGTGGNFNSGSTSGSGSGTGDAEDTDGAEEGSEEGSESSSNATAYIKNLYYTMGDMPMNLGASSLVSGSSALIIKTGFNFTGWYRVATDSDGNPLYADNTVYKDGDSYDVTKRMKMTDEAFDFSKPIDEEHIYLCGDFYEDIKLQVNLLCEDYEGNGTFNSVEYKGVTVQDGNEIADASVNIPKVEGLKDFSSVISNNLGSGYTFVGFYQYDEATQKYSDFTGWPIQYPDPDENGEYHNVVLYAKVLQGDWHIISDAITASYLFASYNTDKNYIKQDIDGNGRAVYNLSSFSGVIYGGEEGHTIKNFVVNGSSPLGQNGRASIFGTIRSTAAFKNVTFENFTANFEIGSRGTTIIDADVKFIANAIDDGASFTNVSISGSLNLKESQYCFVDISESNWLFGGKDDATYSDITVTQATCTITDSNGETVSVYTVNKNNNNSEDI
ncbi:MAG: hypothetical protein K2O89_03755 [Clostridia bacterium]|nr:hypothetical protein [Clostridia bacterium]